MKTWAARTVSYAVVAIVAAAALRFIPNAPPATPPGQLLTTGSPAIRAWAERVDTLGRGETIVGVLARGGISELVARQALSAATMIDPRRVPIGMPITVRTQESDSLPSEIVFHLAIDHLVRIGELFFQGSGNGDNLES